MPDTPDPGEEHPQDPVEQFRRLWNGESQPDVEEYIASAGSLPADMVVDILRYDQQERWRAGDETPAEWYLETFPQVAADPDGAFVLVYGEVIARTERGERPALTDFLLRFPQFTDFLNPLWEVHSALENADQEPTLTFEGPVEAAVSHHVSLVVPGYDIECEVGRGAVGVVYRARQSAINRLVALKVVMEGQLARPEKLIRFLEEARVIARLRHPNIVGIYDLGTHETGPFMALEWVGGGTLAEKIVSGVLAPTQAAVMTMTLAQAAGYAHQNNVIHRDLKPANVLLTEAGEPKIADFGLAKHLHAVNPAGTAMPGQPIGTPTYMAPEQTGEARGEVTPAADVYSLGVVLYEMLTGRVPLAGATVQDTLRLVSTQDPVPPRELNAQVPEDLETICLKCLQKDPKQRYASGQALAEDLGRFLMYEPIAARPASTWDRTRRWFKRHPRWALYSTLAFGIILAVGFTLIGGLVRLDEERKRAEIAERLARERLDDELRLMAERQVQNWHVLLLEAQTLRLTPRPGQRILALQKLKQARSILAETNPDSIPEADLAKLRNEAIACLVLADIRCQNAPFPGAVALHLPYPTANLADLTARSPDGRIGVVALPDSIALWDLANRQPIATIEGQVDEKNAFPAERVIAVQHAGQVYHWEIVLPVGYHVQAEMPKNTAQTPGLQVRPVDFQVLEIVDSTQPERRTSLTSPERTRFRQVRIAGNRIIAEGIESRAWHEWQWDVIRAELRKLGLDWN